MDGDAAAVDAEQLPVGHRDDEHSPIGQPAEARRLRRHVEDPLDAAVEPDGEHAVVMHVGDEEPAVVPARTFEEDEAVGEDGGDERHRGQSDMSLKSVASCFWNGALKVAPKHGPPPLRWSWTATGPVRTERSGMCSLMPFPTATIEAWPSTRPSFSVSAVVPLGDASWLRYVRLVGLSLQQALPPQVPPCSAAMLVVSVA